MSSGKFRKKWNFSDPCDFPRYPCWKDLIWFEVYSSLQPASMCTCSRPLLTRSPDDTAGVQRLFSERKRIFVLSGERTGIAYTPNSHLSLLMYEAEIFKDFTLVASFRCGCPQHIQVIHLNNPSHCCCWSGKFYSFGWDRLY